MIDVKDFKVGVIYMYTSPSGKKYIGQTVNESSRKSHHKNENVNTQTYFGRAIKKYGFENFKYEVIIKFKPTADKIKLKRVLDKLEQRYIKLYKTNDHKFGYNLNKGGEGNLGYEHTEEMKAYLKTIPKTEEQLANLVIGQLKGGIKSEEAKQKMSNAKNKVKKKVGKYDLEDNLMETFTSIEDAARSIKDKIQKTKAKKIGECCNEKRISIYGFHWKFI